MSIKIIKSPDIYLTATELARYQEQYRNEFMYYCGARPDFDEWVAEQVKRGSGTEEENEVMTTVTVRYLHELKDVNGYTCDSCNEIFVASSLPSYCPECGEPISGVKEE